MTNLLLIDDDRLFLCGLQDLLRESMPDMHISVAHTMEEVLHKIDHASYDIAVVDLQLRDGSNVQSVLYALRNKNIKILIASGTATPGMLRFLVGCGASGFHDKAERPELLQQAIVNILSGRTAFPDSVFDTLSNILPDDHFPILEDDEERILAEIICDNRISNKEIARRFDQKSDGWVKIKLKSLCQKFKVHDRDLLVRKLLEYGLIPELDVDATIDRLRRARPPVWPGQ